MALQTASQPVGEGRLGVPSSAGSEFESQRVRVALASGRVVVNREFPSSTSILQILEHVASRLFDGSSASRLSLLNGERILCKSWTLKEADIFSGDVLTVVKRAKRQFAKVELKGTIVGTHLSVLILGPPSPAMALVANTLTGPLGNAIAYFTVNGDLFLQVSVALENRQRTDANLVILVLDASEDFEKSAADMLGRIEGVHTFSRLLVDGARPSVDTVKQAVLWSLVSPDKPRLASREETARLARAKRCQHKEIPSDASMVEAAMEEALDGVLDRIELQRFLGATFVQRSTTLGAACLSAYHEA